MLWAGRRHSKNSVVVGFFFEIVFPVELMVLLLGKFIPSIRTLYISNRNISHTAFVLGGHNEK